MIKQYLAARRQNKEAATLLAAIKTCNRSGLSVVKIVARSGTRYIVNPDGSECVIGRNKK